jgi:hypothetical protein
VAGDKFMELRLASPLFVKNSYKEFHESHTKYLFLILTEKGINGRMDGLGPYKRRSFFLLCKNTD